MDIILLGGSITAAILRSNFGRGELEPITLILAGIGGSLNVIKRFTRAPYLPR